LGTRPFPCDVGLAGSGIAPNEEIFGTKVGSMFFLAIEPAHIGHEVLGMELRYSGVMGYPLSEPSLFNNVEFIAFNGREYGCPFVIGYLDLLLATALMGLCIKSCQ
jgi:hypothetical protein